MEIEQHRWMTSKGWQHGLQSKLGESADLVFLFGSRESLKRQEEIHRLKQCFSKAQFFGCSTAGEILDTEVSDQTLVVTAIQFKNTPIQIAYASCDTPDQSLEAGQRLVAALPKNELRHVLVLSDGLHVNGSDLIRGLSAGLPSGVTITGGLAGDGEKFQETLTICQDCEAKPNRISALGFYGNAIRVGYGSLGGWDPFGPERLITKSKDNVLYELDGKSALELYKNYLGEHAKNLPASGLLFPLVVRKNAQEEGVVRTILGVNEKDQSLTFAGDVQEGFLAKLMKANFNRLVDGAMGAAQVGQHSMGDQNSELALLISCVGRKMILKQRIEEEVEAVRGVLGTKTRLTGFYSYGEISPFTPNGVCELHNQTMTVTLLSEYSA